MVTFDLAGKSILVTGASSGLGLHFAEYLASAGADVVLAARRLEKIEHTAKALRANGLKARAIQMDVTQRSSVDDALAGLNINVLINNAGISADRAAVDLEGDDFDQVIATNLTGVFNVSKAAASAMKDRGGGVIVNIASILGLRVAGNVSAYAASKAAVVQMTKAHALEWARYGIRVNALCPGYIETPLNREFFASPTGAALIKRIPQRRLGQLCDLDAPLGLLCSDASRYMTGSVIAVDGGHLVSSL